MGFFFREQNLPFYNNAKQDGLYFHFIVNEKTPALDIFNWLLIAPLLSSSPSYIE